MNEKEKVGQEGKEIGFSDLPFEEKLKIVEQKVSDLVEERNITAEAAMKKLPPEEMNVIYEYWFLKDKQKKDEEEQKRVTEEEFKKQQELNQKNIEADFKAAPVEEVLKDDLNAKKVGPSAISEFLAKHRVNRKVSKAYKKGGEIIIKCYLGKGYEIIHSKTPIKYVEFISKNEKGEPIKNITRITKTKGHLHGSSIPVHLCVEGIVDSIDPFKNVETNMSAEYFNKLLQGEFQAGLTTGLAIRNENASKFNLEKATPILLLILLAVMAFIAYNQMQLFEVISKLGGV